MQKLNLETFIFFQPKFTAKEKEKFEAKLKDLNKRRKKDGFKRVYMSDVLRNFILKFVKDPNSFDEFIKKG